MTSVLQPESFDDKDLPPLFHAANQSSTHAQKQYLTATAVRLISIVTAGIFGLATWKSGGGSPDWAGVFAAVSFFVAVIVEIYLLKGRPERTWYEGRAAAESVKTLSWRYMVGGEPFRLDVEPESQIDELFLRQLDAVIDALKDLNISPPSSASTQISERMRYLRSRPLEVRKHVYELRRVEDQQLWYQRKANWNAKRAARWAAATLVVEIGGVIAAVMKAIGILEGDLLILAGAIAAAIAAWTQTKQHQTLATAYAVTTLELASVRTMIQWQKNEKDWAQFVNNAEEAFSREHTLWKASRGVESI